MLFDDDMDGHMEHPVQTDFDSGLTEKKADESNRSARTKWLTQAMGLWYNTGMDKKTMILAALAIITMMNIASFVLMGYDKRCARQGKRRVPEKRLFLVTACFGGLGGVLGMKVFHHKTQHWYFKVFFRVLLILQTVALGAAAYRLFM